MAKKMYIGVSGVARNVKQPYVGVSGVARKVKNGYVGINAVARQFFQSSIQLSSLSVGTTVYMNVNGVRKPFIIVHKGNPDSSIYDSSCSGTWLLMKDIYENRYIDENGYSNRYSLSELHTYLNGTFYNLFDSNIRGIIKSVKIPYVAGNTESTLQTGSKGLSTKIFILSAYELGYVYTSKANIILEGATLSYFNNVADSKRIAYYNGTAVTWWTRTPRRGWNDQQQIVNVEGKFYTDNYQLSCLGSGTASIGVRPVLILPSTYWVNGTYDVITS